MKYYNYPDPRGTEVAEDVDSKNANVFLPKELPDTTSASEGDVLTVGSSGLKWAAPSGGGNAFVLKRSASVITNMTNGEIQDAYKKGITFIFEAYGSWTPYSPVMIGLIPSITGSSVSKLLGNGLSVFQNDTTHEELKCNFVEVNITVSTSASQKDEHPTITVNETQVDIPYGGTK